MHFYGGERARHNLYPIRRLYIARRACPGLPHLVDMQCTVCMTNRA